MTLPGVFDVACAEQGAPAERGGRGNDGEGLDVALQECLQGGEGGLAILVLGEVVVGLQALEPAADFDLVAADGPVDVVVEGEEIARGGVVAADVGAGPVICDAPLEAVQPAMTMAPMGLPLTQPGTSTGVEPRK